MPNNSVVLAILCCDIMQNPGLSSPPTTKVRIHYKFSCGICEKPVKSNQKGVQSDCCDLWHHARCLSFCSTDYEGLASASVWICSCCNHPNYSRLLSYSSHPAELSNQFSVFSLHDNQESLDTRSDLGSGTESENESELEPQLLTSSPISTKRTCNTRDIKLCPININSIRGKN